MRDPRSESGRAGLGNSRASLQARLESRQTRKAGSRGLDSGLQDSLFVERETGFEPATSTLARLHSTTELLPQRRAWDTSSAIPMRPSRHSVASHFETSRLAGPLGPRGEEGSPRTGPN